jgi:hypothetical protein
MPALFCESRKPRKFRCTHFWCKFTNQLALKQVFLILKLSERHLPVKLFVYLWTHAGSVFNAHVRGSTSVNMKSAISYTKYSRLKEYFRLFKSKEITFKRTLTSATNTGNEILIYHRVLLEIRFNLFVQNIFMLSPGEIVKLTVKG